MRLGGWSLLAIGIAAAACASTIGPVVPSVQVLVVLDSLDDTLRIIPVDSLDVVHKVPLNVGAFNKHALATQGQVAAIGLGTSVMIVDLAQRHTLCALVPLDAINPIRALAFSDDGSIVYAALPSANKAQNVLAATCSSGGTVVHAPVGFVSARSTFFVIAGSQAPCQALPVPCPETPSWLWTSAPDSIPLSLPGNAQGGVLASDGLLYILDGGNGRQPNARLSQVDPIQKVERKAYVGFGTLPRYIATDGEHVFVASELEGLMVFNTRTSQLERDANSAIPLIGTPRGLAADDLGRVYVAIAGACSGGSLPGSIRVFGPDLVNKQGPTVGRCPVAISVTDIPTTLYHFDN